MKRLSLIPQNTSWTFEDYFKLTTDAEELAAHFGYSFQLERLSLPQQEIDKKRLDETRARLDESFSHVSLTSEVARREFLIAPVLLAAAHEADARVKVEHPLDVDEQLKGTLDYLLRAKNNVLVVEAKNADLQRGFNQLVVELIALDRWLEDEPQESLYGAVSVGDIWRFGILERKAQQITQDLRLYPMPDDLNEVLQALVAVLTR